MGLDDTRRMAAAARRAWQSMQDHEGVVSQAALRKKWGVTQQRVQQVIGLPDFPAPITPGRRALWLAIDVEEWRRAHEARPGKPGPQSTALVAIVTQDHDGAAVRGAWQALKRSGGIVTADDLAAAWRISDRAVRGRAASPDFPEPIVKGRWLGAEAHLWAENREARAAAT